MRLNFLYLDRSLQNQLPIDLQSILNDLHSLLALLRKSMKSTSSSTYLKILTLVNSFLGHLDSKQSKALFHLTLSTKWTLLESYLNHPDWENGFTDDIFATVFRELIKITDAKFKLFENPEKMVSQASPFQCGCVKKLTSKRLKWCTKWFSLRVFRRSLKPTYASQSTVVMWFFLIRFVKRRGN